MTGVKFRTRYHDLIEQVESTNTKVKLWTASGERVHDTASYFALGLFGLNANDTSSLEIIPESPTLGGNTLTPAGTCLAYGVDEKYGHDFGDAQMTKFRATYLRPIASRLRKQLEVGRKVKIDFSDDEVYAMQEMCGFETIARGKSPWCDVFSREEWESFEYARDVMHFYRTGPGNKYAKALGSLWLNATGQVLAHGGLYADGVDLPPFYFSFTHDTDVVSILATLDLFRDGPNAKLPVGQVEKNRSWRMSQVVPMGGRIVFERLACSLDDTKESMGVFIRLNINDGIIAIPGCAQGPGLSCPLKNFLSMLDEKLAEAGNFAQLCDLSEDYPGHITFLHQ
jgi:acid phosphatase